MPSYECFDYLRLQFMVTDVYFTLLGPWSFFSTRKASHWEGLPDIGRPIALYELHVYPIHDLLVLNLYLTKQNKTPSLCCLQQVFFSSFRLIWGINLLGIIFITPAYICLSLIFISFFCSMFFRNLNWMEGTQYRHAGFYRQQTFPTLNSSPFFFFNVSGHGITLSSL